MLFSAKVQAEAAKLKTAGEDAVRLAMRDTILALEGDLLKDFPADPLNFTLRVTGHKRTMDPAYISAFAALAGSAVGGLMSLATSWLTQHVQFRTQQLARDITGREELYKDFIKEASKLYADAYEHNQAEISKFVKLYALVSRMRVLSSPKVIENADRVVRAIIETYRAPNKTFYDVTEILDNDVMNPLREFSSVCREELRRRGSS